MALPRAKDGVLYRSLTGKHGKPDMLQLIVPTVRRTEFMRQCHQVDTVHFVPPWNKYSDVDFGLDGAEMSIVSVDNVRPVRVIIVDAFLAPGHYSQW